MGSSSQIQQARGLARISWAEDWATGSTSGLLVPSEEPRSGLLVPTGPRSGLLAPSDEEQ